MPKMPLPGIGESDKLAVLGIDLRMGGEAAFDGRGKNAAKGVISDGVERAGQLEGEVGFFQRQELARVVDDMRIGHAEVFADHARIGLGRIAEPSEKGLACFPFQLEPRRANPAIAVSGAPILQRKGMHHAVAPEPVIMAARGELRVRAIAVERAVERFRNVAGHGEIGQVALDEDRREGALQRRVVFGKWTGHRDLLRRRGRPRMARL